jgi:hypothetical protein
MDLYISIGLSLIISLIISYYTKNKGFHIDFIAIAFGLYITLGSKLFAANQTQEIDRSGFLFIVLLFIVITVLSIFSITLWLSYNTKFRKARRNKSILLISLGLL